MKKSFVGALIVALALGPLGPLGSDAHAKRLGGGSSKGTQRAVPAQPAPAQPGAPVAPKQATPQPSPTPAQAPAPKRSWMGPLAGLAAGLGIAALASHFGFGEALASAMTGLLIGMLVLAALAFALRHFARRKAAALGQGAPSGLQFAGMPAGMADQNLASPTAPQQPAAFNNVHAFQASPAAAPVVPASFAGFDAQGFEALAAQVFTRLQAANDVGDLTELRRFTTPSLFTLLEADILERQGRIQRTEVLQIQAQVLELAEEHGLHIVSVRFSGLVREQLEAAAAPVNEVWHLQRPMQGGDWAISGIQQL